MTTTENETNATLDDMAGAAKAVSLIDYLWPRVRAAHAALAEARRNKSGQMAELGIRFRTITLLMAAEPARSWDEVKPKVIIQALLRHELAYGGATAGTHLIDAVEACIAADHLVLNGDARPDTTTH